MYITKIIQSAKNKLYSVNNFFYLGILSPIPTRLVIWNLRDSRAISQTDLFRRPTNAYNFDTLLFETVTKLSTQLSRSNLYSRRIFETVWYMFLTSSERKVIYIIIIFNNICYFWEFSPPRNSYFLSLCIPLLNMQRRLYHMPCCLICKTLGSHLGTTFLLLQSALGDTFLDIGWDTSIWYILKLE